MTDYNDYGYSNGYLERKQGGRFEGKIRVDGVDLSPIEGVYFKEDGDMYLWLKRKPLLEYDMEEQVYRARHREPRWEAYLQKTKGGVVAYKGDFMFLRFKYEIRGVWDKTLGLEKQRMNFFVDRKPLAEQHIIKSINERYKHKG